MFEKMWLEFSDMTRDRDRERKQQPVMPTSPKYSYFLQFVITVFVTI